MAKIKVTLHMAGKDKPTKVVTAYTDEEGLLAVHRQIEANVPKSILKAVKKAGGPAKFWTVVHVASGYTTGMTCVDRETAEALSAFLLEGVATREGLGKADGQTAVKAWSRSFLIKVLPYVRKRTTAGEPLTMGDVVSLRSLFKGKKEKKGKKAVKKSYKKAKKAKR